MASSGSGISPPNENFLSRKKKEIIDRSMAFFQQHLDQCLDNAVSAPAKRRPKRARDVEDAAPDRRGAEETGARNKKKRVSHDANGRKFACPFCKHNPAKYKNVRTCSGPGWDDVHRVKEHVYRNHFMKNFCPRCFEHFENADALKNHQRAEIPCKVKQQPWDTITEDQEKQLRARAKAHCSEETRWEEMYRIIFPGEHVPSPYYDSDAETSSSAMYSRFQSTEECKEFLRKELPRLVRPAMEEYVNGLFEELQAKVNQKTAEIIRDVEIQMLRTFQFGAEQSATSVPARVSATPRLGPGSSELAKVDEMLHGLNEDPVYVEFRDGLNLGLEELLADSQGIIGCGNSSVDSAYFTSSSGGSFLGSLAQYNPGYM
ncbi:hypothetical protein MMYC01_206964 [Madurella mycetomatis]|uniref:C2H2-type domain-containing protein n=1 Tax=Madurella mycetomatis TaxID=100816 RepID=A0A175W315_9PEZI|nr:hypothetical protein MMYC01_206964 [Madurella mycetomatis]